MNEGLHLEMSFARQPAGENFENVLCDFLLLSETRAPIPLNYSLSICGVWVS